MKCPRCDSSKTRVVDSREGIEGRSVRRRRECESCEFRFTTFERIEESLPMVVKKGGQRESFDRYKILNGLKKACEKRPVSVMEMEDVVKNIEYKLIESGEKEVSSVSIGDMVIERLRDLDQVAYVRFASVYREFSDVSEFMDTLNHLGTAPVLSATSNLIDLKMSREQRKAIKSNIESSSD
jgi:transcriptional repressor NrdR